MLTMLKMPVASNTEKGRPWESLNNVQPDVYNIITQEHAIFAVHSIPFQSSPLIRDTLDNYGTEFLIPGTCM